VLKPFLQDVVQFPAPDANAFENCWSSGVVAGDSSRIGNFTRLDGALRQPGRLLYLIWPRSGAATLGENLPPVPILLPPLG